ncbi:excalibur calcium-binding domain-containing protein [Kitasatospora sp. NPDC086801]|uniref:excalibur calcium-binding domain-containing protein n=1 Tax=Kitasatospora sp. NPDC086801 TaxID=3364066 RepID=UPI003803C991
MTPDPYRPPGPQAIPPRTAANRLVRAAALLLVPPLAAIWLWRSRRLHVAAKVALTFCCLIGSLFWLGVVTGPKPEKAQPVAAPEATASPTPTATTTTATATTTATPSDAGSAPPPTPSATPTPGAGAGAGAASGIMPDVAQHTAGEARTLLVTAGVAADRIQEHSRYLDLSLPADHDAWVVCADVLQPGSRLYPAAAPTLQLVKPGASCPADRYAALYADERNDPSSPNYQDKTGGSSTGGSSGGTSGGSSGGSAYYKNCDAVKAAGKAPLHRGDPGYRSGLDRDNDGVACER